MKTKLLSALFIISILVMSCKKDTKNQLNSTPKIEENIKGDINDEKQCFLFILENSYEKDGKTITNKDHVTINLTIDNKNVEGDYKVTSQNGKIDGGHFVGTLSENIITSVHIYENNNQTLKDQFILKIEPNKISVLGGEKKLIDGVNTFVDQSKGIYILELPRVNCK